MDNQSQLRSWKLSFFTIWTGQQFSLIGSAVAQFALVWWMTTTTGSATVLATAMMFSYLPEVLLGPFIGALVDRWNRRRIMIVADSFVALASLALMILFWTGSMRIWHVYVVMVARAIGSTFHMPAMQASTSLMVPKDHLPRVAGLNQSVAGMMNIVAPPIGAMLLSWLPLHGIMGIDVATAAFAVLPLLFIAVPQPHRSEQNTSSVFADMCEGWYYIVRWRGLLYLCMLALLLNFFLAPLFSLLPILVTDIFSGNPWQLGALNSSWGIGLMSGGLLLGVWGGFRRRIFTILAGAIGTGIGTLIVGLTPATLFPLALFGLFFSAVLNAICNGTAMGLMQTLVNPQMQGRVFTLISSLANAITPLGIAIAGPLVEAQGIRFLFIFNSIVVLLLASGGFLLRPLLQIEQNATTDMRNDDDLL